MYKQLTTSVKAHHTNKTQQLNPSLLCTMNPLRSPPSTELSVILGVISEPTLG